MNRYVSALLLLSASMAAAAEESPSSQWRYVELSLQDLIQNGYNMVSVTSEAANPDGASVETFFLQKGNSAFKCSETHVNNVKARRSVALFGCWELVKPYAFIPSK